MSKFASLDDLTKQEQLSENTRVFTGTGSSFLPVPGAIAIESIRFDRGELPLTEKRQYVRDSTGFVEETEEPLVKLDRRSDGTPVLIRANISNDGIWPKDENVYITGQWEEQEDENDAREEQEDGKPRRGRKPAAQNGDTKSTD